MAPPSMVDETAGEAGKDNELSPLLWNVYETCSSVVLLVYFF
jgi:hypothetical protein